MWDVFKAYVFFIDGLKERGDLVAHVADKVKRGCLEKNERCKQKWHHDDVSHLLVYLRRDLQIKISGFFSEMLGLTYLTYLQ